MLMKIVQNDQGRSRSFGRKSQKTIELFKNNNYDDYRAVFRAL